MLQIFEYSLLLLQIKRLGCEDDCQNEHNHTEAEIGVNFFQRGTHGWNPNLLFYVIAKEDIVRKINPPKPISVSKTRSVWSFTDI